MTEERPPEQTAPVLWRRTADGSQPAAVKPGAVLKLLARAGRSLGLYGLGHPVAVGSLRDLQKALESLLSGRKSLKVMVSEDTFFADNTVLLEESLQLFPLLQGMQKRKINAVEIEGGVALEELGHFVAVLNLDPEELARAGGAAGYLVAHGVGHIKVAATAAVAEAMAGALKKARGESGAEGKVALSRGLSIHAPEQDAERPTSETGAPGTQSGAASPAAKETTKEAKDAPRQDPAGAEHGSAAPWVNPRDAYSAGLRVMDELTFQATEGVPLELRKARLLVNSFIDIMERDRRALLGLAALKQYDEDTYHHSVNVSILCLLMAEELGLGRTLLTVVGLAGLLHDIGKVRLPREILRKPGKLTPEEGEIVRRHALYGAQALRDMPGLNALAMVVAFEHHANYDLSGYPKITTKKLPHLLSRLVHVADVFDAATSARRRYRRGSAGKEAVRQIIEGVGRIFDPVPAALLARVLAGGELLEDGQVEEAGDGSEASAAAQGESPDATADAGSDVEGRLT